MFSNDRLVILDADGTTIDAFSALDRTFTALGMHLGPLNRFQKRRNLFKYLGGIKEFPRNLRKQISAQKRARLVETLTQVYREEALLYDGMGDLIHRLTTTPGVRVGIVTRNITVEPLETLRQLFKRLDVDSDRFDFLVHLPLRDDKLLAFRALRERFDVNPALAYACGDEAKDYLAAIHSGMHPFIGSYGFEGYDRLTQKFGVPTEVICRTPPELAGRVIHALSSGGHRSDPSEPA